MTDLFGQTPQATAKATSTSQIIRRWILQAGYRRAEKGSPERCRNCQEFYIKRYSGKYFKCRRLGDSNGTARDIRANHVCRFFKPNEK